MPELRFEREPDGHHMVWLEPSHGDKYIGLCIGAAGTKRAAIEDALLNLVRVTEQLRFEAIGETAERLQEAERMLTELGS